MTPLRIPVALVLLVLLSVLSQQLNEPGTCTVYGPGVEEGWTA